MMRLRHFLLVFTLLMTSWAASAQVSFTAKAPTLTALGRPFNVAFVVDAEPDKGSFKAPVFEDFDILAGPSTSVGQSVQFINGKQSSSYNCTYTYVLLPSNSGNFTIPSASIKVDGKTYTTKRIPIEVIAEKQSSDGATGNSNNNGASVKPENSISKDDILLRLKVSSTD